MGETQVPQGAVDVRAAGPLAPIPERDSSALPGMVDLSTYYNTALDDEVHGKPGNTLASLPQGLQAFGGVSFDVRGLIQLAGSHSEPTTHLIFAPAITGIPVGATGEYLHILHAAAWSTAHGTQIGEYVVRYADGGEERIPIRYGINVMDWWFNPEGGSRAEGTAFWTGEKPTGAVIAWTGENPRTQSMGLALRLCVYTWQNPRPRADIREIDFVSSIADSAPMLLALTLV